MAPRRSRYCATSSGMWWTARPSAAAVKRPSKGRPATQARTTAAGSASRGARRRGARGPAAWAGAGGNQRAGRRGRLQLGLGGEGASRADEQRLDSADGRALALGELLVAAPL